VKASNVEKLVLLLTELEATFRYDNRGLKPNATHLQGGGPTLMMTKLGALDVLCDVAEQRYEDLVGESVEMDLGAGYHCRVIGLEKLIELKTAAGREKDKMALPTLRATLEERARQKG
jgi:hypothetical protein